MSYPLAVHGKLTRDCPYYYNDSNRNLKHEWSTFFFVFLFFCYSQIQFCDISGQLEGFNACVFLCDKLDRHNCKIKHTQRKGLCLSGVDVCARRVFISGVCVGVCIYEYVCVCVCVCVNISVSL